MIIKRNISVFVLAICLSLIVPVFIPSQTITVQAASEVKLNKTSDTIIKGKSVQLKVQNTKSKISWSTSNKSIATVDSSGKVTAKKNGSCTVTAKTGSKKYKCKIKVETPSISAKSISVNVGSTSTIKVNKNTQSVIWTSSNTKVATVSGGKIKGIGAGTATIKAKIDSTTYSCVVTVKKSKIEVTGISLYQQANSIYIGDSTTAVATIMPSNASNKNVTWKSSNNNVATVSNGNIIGVNEGTATITVTASDNSIFSTSCTVNVKPLALNASTIELNKGNTYNLQLGKINGSKVIWISTNNNVASIDNSGTITAKQGGVTKILGYYNGKLFSCDVNVLVNTIVLFDNNDITIYFDKVEKETNYLNTAVYLKVQNKGNSSIELMHNAISINGEEASDHNQIDTISIGATKRIKINAEFDFDITNIELKTIAGTITYHFNIPNYEYITRDYSGDLK